MEVNLFESGGEVRSEEAGETGEALTEEGRRLGRRGGGRQKSSELIHQSRRRVFATARGQKSESSPTTLSTPRKSHEFPGSSVPQVFLSSQLDPAPC